MKKKRKAQERRLHVARERARVKEGGGGVKFRKGGSNASRGERGNFIKKAHIVTKKKTVFLGQEKEESALGKKSVRARGNFSKKDITNKPMYAHVPRKGREKAGEKTSLGRGFGGAKEFGQESF